MISETQPMKHLRQLSHEIGPCPIDSPANHAASPALDLVERLQTQTVA